MDQNLAYETGQYYTNPAPMAPIIRYIHYYTNYTVDWRRARPSIVTNNPAYDVVQVTSF